jgi:hypothetical protein
MKTKIIPVLIQKTLFLAGLASAIQLGGSAKAETCNLNNFDAPNNTGQCADNFEMFLGGITTNEITRYFLDNNSATYHGFPNVTTVQQPGGVTIIWTGNTNCGATTSHFGVTIADCMQPTATNIPGATYTWTYNGVPIGNIPTVWQTLTFNPASGYVQQVVFNGGSNTPVYIQRLLNDSPTQLNLVDLMPDKQIYLEAQPVDAAPILLYPGEYVTSAIPVGFENGAVAPIVNVYKYNNGLPPVNYVISHIAALNFAGGLEQNTLDNYTVTNDTGTIANDFETFIGGITDLSEIYGYYTNAADPTYPGYPIVSAQLVAGGALITWTGSQTLPGNYAHFGIRTSNNAQPIPQSLPAVQCWWTSGETNIGIMPITWPNFLNCGNNYFNGTNALQVGFVNPTTNIIYIQRRINWLPTPPLLEQLYAASPIFTGGTLVDLNPQPLPPLQALVNNFPSNGSNTTYVVAYQLWTTPDFGQTPLTFVTANATAEPQTVLGISQSGGNLKITGTGGYEGFRYTLLQSGPPNSQGFIWSPTGGGVFDESGSFFDIFVEPQTDEFWRLLTK